MKTTSIKILKLVGGVALIFGMANCTPEQSTRKRSFEDGSVEVTAQQPIVEKSAEARRLEALMVDAEGYVSQQISLAGENVDASMLMLQVINPLRETVLDINYLMIDENRNAKTEEGRFIVPRLVTLFNEAIIMVYQSNPAMITSTDLLAKYKETLFWDCDQQLRGSCEFVKFFRSNDSVNMTQIVKMIHDQESDDGEKLRLIRAGFDLKNRRLDAALRFMLLERIAGSLEMERSRTLNPIRRRQDADLFANILKVNITNVSGDQKYVDLIKSLNPWMLSRNVDSAKNPAMTDIIALASDQLLYDDNRKLSKEMEEEVIPELLVSIGKNYEQGPQFIQSNIRGEWKAAYNEYAEAKIAGAPLPSLTPMQQKIFPQIEGGVDVELYGPESKEILNTLLTDVSFEGDELDEYFFLANRAFYGHFNLDDATAFWSNTNKDVNRLMKEVEKLLKVQIVNNIVLTNVRMNDFYNRNENTKLIELLRESDKEASKIRKAWTKTIVRSQAIKSFITRVVNANNLDSDGAKVYDRINSSVDAMTKNIKFLVTYPNMFPLMHVMASLEMQDTIRSFWGTFTVDSLTVISYFFSGHFFPWFNFGNDGERLDSTEIMYTYYYALQTQIFETYSTNTLVNFSHPEFFEVVVKKMLLPNEKELDADRRALLQKVEEFKNNASAMQAMCSEEKRLQAAEAADLAQFKEQMGDNFDWYQVMKGQNVMRPRNRVKNQMSFLDIGYSLYDGTNGKADKIGNYVGQIYSTGVRKVFERMRIEFPLKEVMAGTILDVFKNAKGGDQSEIEDIFNAQFDEYYRLKAEYIDMYFNAEEQVRGCDWLFLQRDRDIVHMMIFREAEELSILFDKVWDVLSPLSQEEMTALAPDSPQIQQLELIRQEFGLSTQSDNYPVEYQNRHGYNKLTPSRLTSFKMDTATRVVKYLNELFPGQYSVTLPADFKTSAIYAEVSPDLVYFDWSAEDKDVAREAFVRSGIKALANQMGWANTATAMRDAFEKGAILTNLFKLGEISRNPEIDCKDPQITNEIKEKECVKISAQELIDHYKKTIDFLNIDDRDMDVLNLLGRESKYDISLYEEVIKKKDEHVLYSYYDLIFKRVYADSPVKAADETWFKPTMVQYVDSVHKINGSTFIFEAPEYINEAYVRRYSAWLSGYYQKNIEFLKEVKGQKDEVEDFRFRYRTDRVHTLGRNKNDLSDNKRVSLEPLISDLIFNKFEGLSQSLNNETSGYFSSVLRQYNSEIFELVSPDQGAE